MMNESEIRCDIRGLVLIRATYAAGEPRTNQRRNAGTSRNGIIPSTTLTSENAINGP
jgi:hypothetical protein